MRDIITTDQNETQLSNVENAENAINAQINEMLLDLHSAISPKSVQTVSFTQMASLGTGIAALIPTFRTVTQTVEVNTRGLFRLANASYGDVLKAAKDGNYWGAFKKLDGNSKFVKLQEAGPLTATNQITLPVNPATIMMAAALASIDQKLDTIAETGRQIISFLETEKEAKIEADVKTLASIVSGYKYNWDNELYVNSNHKMVLDIQRAARANMISYRKSAEEHLKAIKPLVEQKKVETAFETLVKEFQFYKLSLYSYSLASLLEILLSGNFKEGYISEKEFRA